jgi:hypothetical protein
MWRVGSTVTLPTRSKDTLGNSRVRLEPAAVLFHEQQKWSAGVVLQNVWSLGGTGTDEVKEFSDQHPFKYNFSRSWYLCSSSTITADWLEESGDHWTVPVGLGVGKVLTMGKQSASIAL